jgi:hypothetical protein
VDMAGPSVCTFDRIAAFLKDRGADSFSHANRRTLYDHLLSTQRILSTWSQPLSMQNAGLLHSIYSTDTYQKQLIDFSWRPAVQELAGKDAERLAFLFCVTSRSDLWQQVQLNQTIGEHGLTVRRHSGESNEHLSCEEIRALLVLHMANTAEQACMPGGEPRPWLARASRMGSRVRKIGSPVPPVFSCCFKVLTDEDERTALTAYRNGVETSARSISDAARYFSIAEAACPYVAEPMIWKAYTCTVAGNTADALRHIARARRTLSEWGVPWDKRLSFEEWTMLLSDLEGAASRPFGHDLVLSLDAFSPGGALRKISYLHHSVDLP